MIESVVVAPIASYQNRTIFLPVFARNATVYRLNEYLWQEVVVGLFRAVKRTTLERAIAPTTDLGQKTLQRS